MLIDEKQSIWSEKYKPQTIDDVILPEKLRTSIKTGLENGTLPNLGLWSYLPGLGKSSLANAIANHQNVEAYWVNASLNKGIDLIRNEIHSFASRRSISDKLKVVIMDESDRISADAQAAFRGFIDEFSNNCRFIFTGNYKENIIEPLLNRLENYDFLDFNKTDMVPQIVNRILFILNNENIKFDNSSIRKIIDKNYPSVRGMIVDLKRYSSTGELNVSGISNDELSEIINALKSKSFENLSKSVQNLTCPDAFFSVLYKNIDKLFSKPEQISRAIVILAKYQDMGTRVRDKYLNILACFCELNAIC